MPYWDVLYSDLFVAQSPVLAIQEKTQLECQSISSLYYQFHLGECCVNRCKGALNVCQLLNSPKYLLLLLLLCIASRRCGHHAFCKPSVEPEILVNDKYVLKAQKKAVEEITKITVLRISYSSLATRASYV